MAAHRRFLPFVLLALPLLGVGCSTNMTSGTDGGADFRMSAGDLAGADLSASGDLSGSAPDLLHLGASGDCHSDADCPGGACVELHPGGFRVCATPPVEATSCMHDGIDQCCKTADCTAPAKCFTGPPQPQCTGVVRLAFNQCESNACKQASDCMNNGVCVPAGALHFNVSGCLPASCHVDSDCTKMPGGVCAPVDDPCCNDAIGLFCVYAGVGCRSNADCKAGNHCAVSGTDSQCVAGPPICPA